MPGPCAPDQAGICLPILQTAPLDMPIFGVCLGHQAIAQVFGARVVRAAQVMHGKTSRIHHEGKGVFAGLNKPLTVTRYHSLVVKRETLPDCLEITAWTQLDDGSVDEIMGLRHKQLNIEGVQFHPESILTPKGKIMLRNFLEI